MTYVCGRVCRQIYEDSIVLQSVFTSTRERLEKISAVSKAQPPPAPKPTVEESDDDSEPWDLTVREKKTFESPAREKPTVIPVTTERPTVSSEHIPSTKGKKINPQSPWFSQILQPLLDQVRELP